MFERVRNVVGATIMAAAVVVTPMAGASAAAAPDAQRQSGLVNVNLINVASGNQVSVAVPVGVAANVCGLSVAAVLSAAGTGGTVCTATVDDRTFQRLTR
jgi:hypothetical protein